MIKTMIESKYVRQPLEYWLYLRIKQSTQRPQSSLLDSDH